MGDAELTIVCLCAQWCGTCRDWRPVMDTLAAANPAWRWRWLDIEDEAALLGELDVETLPSLLVARGAQVLFFGPVLPRAELLGRLLDTLSRQPQASSGLPEGVDELWERLRRP
ncbi:thioredoxin family protein [Hydrogenophaga sp.]|uniref:thioredoxin family protein n=1 Tax=Hydrogenophaga sp. TaxID=1904254 RepID=UPI00260D2357|nr:thioredoxin family protein [Hydrogenophaga sp.]